MGHDGVWRPLLSQKGGRGSHLTEFGQGMPRCRKNRGERHFLGQGTSPRRLPICERGAEEETPKEPLEEQLGGQGAMQSRAQSALRAAEPTTLGAPSELPESHHEVKGGKHACEHVSFQTQGRGQPCSLIQPRQAPPPERAQGRGWTAPSWPGGSPGCS